MDYKEIVGSFFFKQILSDSINNKVILEALGLIGFSLITVHDCSCKWTEISVVTVTVEMGEIWHPVETHG